MGLFGRKDTDRSDAQAAQSGSGAGARPLGVEYIEKSLGNLGWGAAPRHGDLFRFPMDTGVMVTVAPTTVGDIIISGSTPLPPGVERARDARPACNWWNLTGLGVVAYTAQTPEGEVVIAEGVIHNWTAYTQEQFDLWFRMSYSMIVEFHALISDRHSRLWTKSLD